MKLSALSLGCQGFECVRSACHFTQKVSTALFWTKSDPLFGQLKDELFLPEKFSWILKMLAFAYKFIYSWFSKFLTIQEKTMLCYIFKSRFFFLDSCFTFCPKNIVCFFFLLSMVHFDGLTAPRFLRLPSDVYTEREIELQLFTWMSSLSSHFIYELLATRWCADSKKKRIHTA